MLRVSLRAGYSVYVLHASAAIWPYALAHGRVYEHGDIYLARQWSVLTHTYVCFKGLYKAFLRDTENVSYAL